MDVFKAHITPAAKQAAEDNNIKIHLIPAGMTDEYQPLDKRIFGPMKSHARKMFRLAIRENPDLKRTKKDACAEIVRCWELLSPDTIQESFEHLKDKEIWDVQRNDDFNMLFHTRAYCTASKMVQAQMRDDLYKCDTV